nr:unnamed protein product [Callosobruchus analis]
MAISRLLSNYDATLKELLLKPKENDDNVPKEIKICESFFGFIAVTDCSAAGLKTVILDLTK